MNEFLKTLAPTAATLLAGPLAGFAVKFLADKVGASEETVEAVTNAIKGAGETPEGRVKLAEIDAALKAHALDVGLDMNRLAVQNATDINKTMQAEAAAEHWPTYWWRPFIGFQFGFYILGQWLLPLFKIQPPTVDPQLMLVVGAILGVASWYRGKMQADPNIPTVNRG